MSSGPCWEGHDGKVILGAVLHGRDYVDGGKVMVGEQHVGDVRRAMSLMS